MSTDASQSQGGADAPASVNNPRSAAAAAGAWQSVSSSFSPPS